MCFQRYNQAQQASSVIQALATFWRERRVLVQGHFLDRRATAATRANRPRFLDNFHWAPVGRSKPTRACKDRVPT